MRLSVSRISITGTVAVLLFLGSSRADGITGLNTTVLAEKPTTLSRVVKDDIAEIEKALTPLVTATYPTAKIAWNGDTLTIWLGETQIPPNKRDYRVKATQEKNEGDADTSFFIFLSKHHDYYPFQGSKALAPEIMSGTEICGLRYDLRPSLPKTRGANTDREEFQDIPRDSRAYQDLQWLAAADLLQYPQGDFRGGWATTRYEFGAAMVRLGVQYGLPGFAPPEFSSQLETRGAVHALKEIDADQNLLARKKKLALALKNRPVLKTSLVFLQTEFEPEISRSEGYVHIRKEDGHPKPQTFHEYISLGLSSGQSIDPHFLKGIERAVADYAAKNLKVEQDLSRR